MRMKRFEDKLMKNIRGGLVIFCGFLVIGMNIGMRSVSAEIEADLTESTETETEGDTEEIIVDNTAPQVALALDERGDKVAQAGKTFFFGELNEQGKPCIVFSMKVKDCEERKEEIVGMDLEVETETEAIIEVEKPSGLQQVRVELNGEAAFEKRYADVTEIIYEDDVLFDLGKVTLADTYVGMITVIDNAGNETVLPLEIQKDMEGPTVRDVNLSEAVNVVAGTYFYNSDVMVEVSCEDAGVGVMAVEWGISARESAAATEDNFMIMERVETNEKGQAEFMIQALEETAFEEVVFVRGIDAFGNVGPVVMLNPIVIETQKQHEDMGELEPHLLAELITETPYEDAMGKPLYAGDTQSVVVIQVNATDILNGVSKIEWEVISEKGKYENRSTEEETDFVKIVNEEVIIDVSGLDENNVVVRMRMTDFSGNQTIEEVAFSVDWTAPILEVKFDETLPDEEYTNVYSAKRTAQISITDRNINMQQVLIDITNSEGDIPSIGEWGFSIDEHNPDKITCMTAVTFGEDGDYSIRVRCKDLAGHETAIVDIPEFTIDMTKPVVSVIYQNQDVANGNYFAEPQVAVIQITEHNFAEERIEVHGTAIEGETKIAFPQIQAWSSEGDVHTTTLTCELDAFYQFDIDYVDKAGNQAETFVGEAFFVDRTMPQIEITGVKDKSANNGIIAPVISFSDANYDENSVSVAATGANHGESLMTYVVQEQGQGQIYRYNDIPMERELDDIYTLTASATDLAGNTYAKTITFSVNRFGSVYVFEDPLKEMAGSYVKDDVDVRFTEINVDVLEDDSIRVVVDKNGVARNLEKEKDYTITEISENDTWHQYEYRIDESVFEGDGRYIVTVYSIDAAGNINENRDETKQAEIMFGVDKTAPNVMPINIASQGEYDAEEKTASIIVNDNLVLKDVEIFVGDSQCEFLTEEDNYTFQIPSSDVRQNITIIATDAAGNRTNYVINDVLVTTNAMIRWYNNKTLFMGSILSFIVLCGAGVTVILLGKK